MNDNAMSNKRVKVIGILSFIICVIVISIVVSYKIKCNKDNETVIQTTIETLTGRITKASVDSNGNFPTVYYILDEDNLTRGFFTWDIYNLCRDNVDKSIVVERTILTYKNGRKEQYVSNFIRVD